MNMSTSQHDNAQPGTGRRSRSTLAQRRSRARDTQSVRPHGNGNALFQLPRRIGQLLSHSRIPWLGIVTLVLGAGALLVTSGPRLGIPRARAAAAPHVYTGRAKLSSSGPFARHWTDLGHGTTLAITIATGDVKPGSLTFAFGLPDGNSLVGPVAFTGDSSTQPPTSTGSMTNCFTSAALPPDTIYYFLQVRLGQSALAAYAQVYYVLPTSPDASVFCDAHQRVGAFAELDAGCTITDCGPSPLDTAAPAVATFDDNLVKAAGGGDWTAVYQLSSESVTGQYMPDEFAAAMKQQESQVGTITAISPLTAAPTIQLDPTGQAYFAVTQTVTLDKGGNTSTRDVTSYYILEEGRWRFWFSA
jgi:hypothetical protein